VGARRRRRPAKGTDEDLSTWRRATAAAAAVVQLPRERARAGTRVSRSTRLFAEGKRVQTPNSILLPPVQKNIYMIIGFVIPVNQINSNLIKILILI
jgi:hypothetical protein